MQYFVLAFKVLVEANLGVFDEVELELRALRLHQAPHGPHHVTSQSELVHFIVELIHSLVIDRHVRLLLQVELVQFAVK